MTDHVTTQTAVVATLPDGTQIAVDQLPTGEMVQIIKLYDGAPDSTNAASVSAAGALKVDGSAVTQPVSATALPLPAGASTSASQATEITALGSLLTELQQKLEPGDAVVVSALPAGLATGAKQDTGNNSVASIDTKTPALVGGRVPVDGSGVTQPVSGPLTDAQLRATPVPVSGTVTITDGSGPVTVDGTVAISGTVPVSAAALPLPAGAATDASLVTLDTDLKAEIGAVGTIPGAYTVLDRLNQIGAKIDAARAANATEATLRSVLAALSKPIPPRAPLTLLHR